MTIIDEIINELDNIVADKVSYIEITQDQYDRYLEYIKPQGRPTIHQQKFCFRGIALKVK